jgi:hypothetical protein
MTELCPSLGKQTCVHGFSLFAMAVRERYRLLRLWLKE